MALLQPVHKISTDLDNKKFSLSIFLGSSKAFDTVDNNICITKLQKYGQSQFICHLQEVLH